MAGRSFFTWSLADLISSTNFDGFFGDTMGGITEDYYQAGLSRHNQSIAMEPEAFHEASDYNWMTLGWGYWQELSGANKTYTRLTASMQRQEQDLAVGRLPHLLLVVEYGRHAGGGFELLFHGLSR